MAPLHLGLDVGTQGSKALLLDGETGRVLGLGSAAHNFVAGLPPGAAEQDPESWLAACAAASAAALKQAAEALGLSTAAVAARVGGVGVSGQQHGLVVLDGQGAVLRPAKLWCDTQTAPEAAELSATLGCHVPAGFTASKVLWLARHEPERWAATRHVLLPHDFLNARLTGRFTAEAGDASGTGWFDVAARTWDLTAAARIDARLPDCLAPLLEAGQPAGELQRQGTALLGLPVGTPVAVGSGDNMCAALGVGATRVGTGLISLGTSATVGVYSAAPVTDARGVLAAFCDGSGGWLPLLCVMNCTNLTEEIRAAVADAGGDAELGALTAAAAAVPPGCDGLLLLPFLQGERVPDLPLATATLLGLRPGLLRAGHLFRAALEGVALNLAAGAERFGELGVPLQSLRVTGGGAANRLWLSILANALGRPVTVAPQTECAALGAALLSVWTVRRLAGEAVDCATVVDALVAPPRDQVQPDASALQTWSDLRGRFAQAVTRLHGERAR